MSGLKKLIMAANQIEDDAIESLPSPYILCEYIKCNGAQYIDLGYPLGYKDKIELDIQPNLQNGNYQSLFGFDYNNGGYGFFMYFRANEPVKSIFGKTTNSSITLDGNRCKLNYSKTGIWKNGFFHPWNSAPTDFVSSGNIYIGSSNRNGSVVYSFWGQIYDVKVYQNGILTHRYAPALNSETKIAGLYDIATGVFYPSASKTTFDYKIKGSDIPYLEFIALEDDGLQVSISKSDTQYSLDKKNWTDLPADTLTPLINKGYSLYFRAEITPDGTDTGIGTFTTTARCNINGSPMSLTYGDFCSGVSKLPSKYCFVKLFSGTSIVRILNAVDFLQATTLTEYCYARMFQDCSYLENAPLLPALRLVGYVYANMFLNCTSLTDVPDLPAWTAFYISDCTSMFKGCTSLRMQPKITAKSLGYFTCSNMFDGCTSLETTQESLTLNAYSRCFEYMYKDCIALTQAPDIVSEKSSESAGFALNSMFTNCKNLVKSPNKIKLHAYAGDTCAGTFSGCVSLEESPIIYDAPVSGSYTFRGLFDGCKSLKKIIFLVTESPDNNSSRFTNWKAGVAASGELILNKNITWDPPTWFVPSGWTVKYCDPDDITDVRETKEEFNVTENECLGLEYLQTDGNQYIDSCIILNSNSRVEIEIAAANSSSIQFAFGNLMSSDFRASLNLTNASGNTRFGDTTYEGNLYKSGRYIYAVDKSGIYRGEEKVADWEPETSDFSLNSSFYILANKGTTGAQYKMAMGTRLYGVKVYENGNLIADMVPALRRQKNKLGLYDKANKRFLTNIGTGEFTYQ